MQRCGPIEVAAALAEGDDPTLILVDREANDEAVLALRAEAESRGIHVIEGSARDLWRMSRETCGEEAPAILALVGRDPAAGAASQLEGGGLVWLLAGARYAQNVGYSIRTAEVSGAGAVIVDADLSGEERRNAIRASMRADRFISVEWMDCAEACSLARGAGARIIAIEDVGEAEPWDVDLRGPILLVVGGERHGIPEEVLAEADEVVRIPMAGFVPSYNLQAPLAVVAIEALRQRRS